MKSNRKKTTSNLSRVINATQPTNRIWVRILHVLLYIFIFLSSLYPYSDNDWGWHYRYGEYFIKTGHIMRSDIYSWTLPGYQWINHSWAYDPILYLIFNTFGFLGMMIAGALVSVFVFFLLNRICRLNVWLKGMLAVLYVELVGNVVWQGLRSQEVSIIFFAILMYILIKGGKSKRTIFFLPALFLFWVNFHGSFALGLVITALFIVGHVINYAFSTYALHEKNVLTSIHFPYVLTAFSLSAITTLINPFGMNVYYEVLRHSNNIWLRNVEEWIPINFTIGCSLCNFIIIYTVLLFGSFLIRRKREDIPYILISLFMLYLALSARRYVALYMVMTFPLLQMTIAMLGGMLEKVRIKTWLMLIVFIVGVEIVLGRRILPSHMFNYSYQDFCNNSARCSEPMTQYLIKNPPKGRGLNQYDWGGYFIGRGVPFKLFIDGRMHLWKQDEYMPFADFIGMYYWDDFEKFKEYRFDWLLVGSGSNIDNRIRSSTELGYWKEIYRDGYGVYYVKANETNWNWTN